MRRTFRLSDVLLSTYLFIFAQCCPYLNATHCAHGLQPGVAGRVCNTRATKTSCQSTNPIDEDAFVSNAKLIGFQASGVTNIHFHVGLGEHVAQFIGPATTSEPSDMTLPCTTNGSCSNSNRNQGRSRVLALGRNIGTTSIQGATDFLDNRSSIQTEAFTNEAIQYVSPHGSDSNDGLSWGKAKSTVVAAYNALPSDGGTIYFTTGARAHPIANCGIWIMGSKDPNYSNPPRCWVKQPASKSVAFIGVPGTAGGQSGRGGPTAIIRGCGAQNDPNHPCIWLSDTVYSLSFQNISIPSPGRGILIGIDSNGNRVTQATVAWVFDNVACQVNNVAGTGGPCMDVGAASYFGRIQHSTFAGNNTCSATSDCAFGLVINPTARGAGSGTIFMYDNQFNGGGFREYPGNTSYGIYIDDITGESLQTGMPLVHFKDATLALNAYVRNAESYDASGGAAVLVDSGANANSVHEEGTVQGGFGADPLQGPLTFNGTFAIGPQSTKVTPEQRGQVGTGFGNRFVGQFDAARRLFSPVAARFTNQVSTVPSNWTKTGTQTVTTVGAPDGTSNTAGRFVSSSRSVDRVSFGTYSVNGTGAVGDTFIFGAWVRSPGGNGFSGNVPLSVFINNANVLSCSSTLCSAFQYILGDGEWEWASGIFTITSLHNSTYTVYLQGATDSAHTAEFYAPILLALPTGTVSANEAYYIAEHLAPYASACSVGAVCGLPGQVLQMPGNVQSQFVIGNLGTTFANKNVSLSAAWGSGASVSASIGSSQRFSFIATSNGTGQSANPAMMITFPVTWPVRPIFLCKQVGGTGPLMTVSGENTASTTTMTLTFSGTPVSGSTYVFVCEGE